MYPLVSVITPTTTDREQFNERIKQIFESQDYPNKEHLLDYDSGNVGEKRNRLCKCAKGSIILHMDSDDHYAPDWISRSVYALYSTDKDIVGLSTAVFHSPSLNKSWHYVYPPNENLIGATLCYKKSFWEQKKFNNIMEGEDNDFIRGSRFAAHDYINGFIATIHEGNTSPKNISGERWVLINMLIPELKNIVSVTPE